SLRVGNILVGNLGQAAAIEMTISGMKVQVEGEITFAVTGAEAPVSINDLPIPRWEAHLAHDGDIISIGLATSGTRMYLAVSGGINVAEIMGSRSTFLRGKIGGFDGRALKAGDIIDIGNPAISLDIITGNFAPKALQAIMPNDATNIRVLLGPQDDYFSEETKELFFSSPYTITDESDRMGYRLAGTKLSHIGKADIISDGIAPGSIQVPGHGQPIVLLADRQTTGGYAKIATVIGADLSLLGQMKPRQTIKFVSVSREEAVAALRVVEEKLTRLPYKSRRVKMLSVVFGEHNFNVEVREVVREETK
ncbi:MAG: biotin-dependent carboxyltransferase family protein, partial [bacterium]|nr:biotin-dependent carboxyltransferase family protein [bacterium]